MNDRTQTMIETLKELRLPELRARYAEVFGEPTRSRNKAYRKMVALMEQAVGAGSSIRVAFVHVAAREEAQKIRALVEERFTVVESLITELSPALGVHSGPGAAGVCFYPVS